MAMPPIKLSRVRRVKPQSGSKGPVGIKGPVGLRGPSSGSIAKLRATYTGTSMQSNHHPRRKNTNGKNRFGTQEISNPMMLNDLFGVRYDYLGHDGEDMASESEYVAGSDAMYDETPRQLEFNFKTNDELEFDLRHAIAKYEHAIDRMGEYAVNWHYLMEDLERNPHLAKMFLDIQTMRKLSGGGVPTT